MAVRNARLYTKISRPGEGPSSSASLSLIVPEGWGHSRCCASDGTPALPNPGLARPVWARSPKRRPRGSVTHGASTRFAAVTYAGMLASTASCAKPHLS
jgi:hypothetical protein